MTDLSGWLNINKDLDLTSHDLVYKIRKKFSIRKVGHAGTLDPKATGVMVLAVGKATRMIQFLQEKKKYIAEIYLGKTTDTLDAEGVVQTETEFDLLPETIINSLNKFTGHISQIPPMTSAVHHNGIKLYKLARKGITVERKPRYTEIYQINFIKYEKPLLKIEVYCQSGTYIRTLADDIGKYLGCGAYLFSLNRTLANEVFKLENSKAIEDINQNDLIDISYPLSHLDFAILQEQYQQNYLQGQSVSQLNTEDGFVRVLDQGKKLIGIGRITDNQLKPYINLKQPD